MARLNRGNSVTDAAVSFSILPISSIEITSNNEYPAALSSKTNKVDASVMMNLRYEKVERRREDATLLI
jgi:hypothetical protein